MHPNSYVAQQGLAAEEVVVDIKGLGIVSIIVSKHNNVILTDKVSIGKPRQLQSPTQAVQTGAAALNTTLLALEARKVVSISVYCYYPANKLLKVVDKVV